MDLVKNFSLFLKKLACFQIQTLYSKKPGSFIIHTWETLWYIKTYFTKIRISQLWSFYSFLSNMHTLHLLLLLCSLLRCQIRIHRSHSSAFVSSTFRGLSPCRGAGALPEQLKHSSCLREVGWRGYLCPPSHPSLLWQDRSGGAIQSPPDQKSHYPEPGATGQQHRERGPSWELNPPLPRASALCTQLSQTSEVRWYK